MKIRVLSKSIKEFTKSYYSIRSKKIINLAKQIDEKKNKELTLAGCFFLKKKNYIVIKSGKK